MISMCPMSSTPSSAKICTNVPSGEIQYCGGTCSSQGPLASCCKDTGPNYDLAAGCCPAGYFCCAEEGCGPSGCITHNKGCCPTHYLLQRPRLCHQLNPPAVETASSSGQMILSVVVPTSAACRLKCAVACCCGHSKCCAANTTCCQASPDAADGECCELGSTCCGGKCYKHGNTCIKDQCMDSSCQFNASGHVFLS
ncbi:hypothetical protein QOT17_023912 [Balamuthia mandrillaris]